MTRPPCSPLAVLFILALFALPAFAQPPQWSGIYPHLAYHNRGGECGTGAVVRWADRLWIVTYSPHSPGGSSDKLYEIDNDLNITTRPESIGGTPANRMIHRESNQLFIGPYAIDAERNVRVIPYTKMFGRPTGNARHLTDPARLIYYATMEEGFYEVDVKTLEVKELYSDGNHKSDAPTAPLPGYHGKGLYSGQGRLVYANNGEASAEARQRPDVPSGVLAQWDGEDWEVVRRNQFTEVTGPGGIYGNENPESAPIWSIGWDHRSLILAVLDGGKWHYFRLPKASHAYDGAHGWNTEWPRIRDIGEDHLLMTMHGMFWKFPKSFTAENTKGIAPRSTYLKVIGDFSRWNDRIVFGCDDSAKNEFLNTRKSKGHIQGPGKSQSNLWFVEPERIDQLGAPVAKGAVWLSEPVKADTWSDRFLVGGFAHKGLHLWNPGETATTIRLKVDGSEDRAIQVAAKSYQWVSLNGLPNATWVELASAQDLPEFTATFHLSGPQPNRGGQELFEGISAADATSYSAGIIRARDTEPSRLHFAANVVKDGKLESEGYYEVNEKMELVKVTDATAHAWLKENVAIPQEVITWDSASLIFTDEDGSKYRLPYGSRELQKNGPLGDPRTDREVATERDLVNCGGLFYELPARNAGGLAKIRPITAHNRRIHDYCSWRGLMVISGIDFATAENRHILRSEDGLAALWVGAIDDLWKFGAPQGTGGPWKETAVEADKPSEPYLMNGFEEKSLTVSHNHDQPVEIRVEIDIDASGRFVPYQTLKVPAGQTISYDFPKGFQAYWVRTVAGTNCQATAQLEYK